MKRFGVVVLVLAGIWVITQSLLLLDYPISLALWGPGSGHSTALTLALFLLPALVTLGFGVFLIARRRRLAERWFPGDGPAISLSGLSLLRIGILLIGVLLTAQSVPTLLGAVAQTFARVELASIGGLSDVLWGTLPTMVVAVGQATVGLLLIALSNRLTRRLWQGRPAEAPVHELPTCPSCGAHYDPEDYRDGVFPPTCERCGAPLDIGSRTS